MQDQAQYISTGDVATDIVTSLFAPGELGKKIEIGGIIYQRVKVAASITVAAGETAMWSAAQRLLFTVTNATSGVDGLCAGAFLGAPAAGSYCWIGKKGSLSCKYLDSPTVAPDTTGKATIVNTATTAGRFDCVTSAAMSRQVGRTVGAQDGTSKLALTFLDIED